MLEFKQYFIDCFGAVPEYNKYGGLLCGQRGFEGFRLFSQIGADRGKDIDDISFEAEEAIG